MLKCREALCKSLDIRRWRIGKGEWDGEEEDCVARSIFDPPSSWFCNDAILLEVCAAIWTASGCPEPDWIAACPKIVRAQSDRETGHGKGVRV